MIDSSTEKLIENVYNKYPKDNDIWQLLQAFISTYQDVKELKITVRELENRIKVNEAAYSGLFNRLT